MMAPDKRIEEVELFFENLDLSGLTPDKLADLYAIVQHGQVKIGQALLDASCCKVD